MHIEINDVPVQLCRYPGFMGHEELVLPMLVIGRCDTLGKVEHCINSDFVPDNLSNTAAAGFTAGLDCNNVIDLSGIFYDTNFCYDASWKEISEITEALELLSREYAFFLEMSAAPLQDAFLGRCRFISRDKLGDFHPGPDMINETTQPSSAAEVLAAFLEYSNTDLDAQLHAIYGDHLRSGSFAGAFGDSEYYSSGYVIWIEQEGVLRAWHRVTYVPK